jgi:hypothetical protein
MSKNQFKPVFTNDRNPPEWTATHPHGGLINGGFKSKEDAESQCNAWNRANEQLRNQTRKWND